MRRPSAINNQNKIFTINRIKLSLFVFNLSTLLGDFIDSLNGDKNKPANNELQRLYIKEYNEKEQNF